MATSSGELPTFKEAQLWAEAESFVEESDNASFAYCGAHPSGLPFERVEAVSWYLASKWAEYHDRESLNGLRRWFRRLRNWRFWPRWLR